MNDLSTGAVVCTESATSAAKAHYDEKLQDHSTPRPLEGPMSDFGLLLFEQAEAAAKGQRSMLMEGRRQIAREVTGIIGTLSAHKGPMHVINELIALCRREV